MVFIDDVDLASFSYYYGIYNRHVSLLIILSYIQHSIIIIVFILILRQMTFPLRALPLSHSYNKSTVAWYSNISSLINIYKTNILIEYDIIMPFIFLLVEVSRIHYQQQIRIWC